MSRSSGRTAVDLVEPLSLGLKLSLSGYFIAQKIPLGRALRADVVLALLRIGTPEALGAAQELAGVAITQCPAAIPPWPPKPILRKPRSVVARVSRNPMLPTTDAFQRFRKIHVGLTKEQCLARGVTQRDLTTWTRKKHVEFHTV